MRLTPLQEERYARHLLLDGLTGEGQEKLLAASVALRGTGRAALWAARYLAASGVGQLVVETEALLRACAALGPDTQVRVGPVAAGVDARGEDAEAGAALALEVVARLVGARP